VEGKKDEEKNQPKDTKNGDRSVATLTLDKKTGFTTKGPHINSGKGTFQEGTCTNKNKTEDSKKKQEGERGGGTKCCC